MTQGKNASSNRTKAFMVSRWREDRDWPEVFREVLLLWAGSAILAGWLSSLLCLEYARIPVCAFLCLPSILIGVYFPLWSAGRRRAAGILMGLVPLSAFFIPPLRRGLEGLCFDAYTGLTGKGILFFHRGMLSDELFLKTAALALMGFWLILPVRFIILHKELSWLYCLVFLLSEMRLGEGKTVYWFFALLFWLMFLHLISMRAFPVPALFLALLIISFWAGFGNNPGTGWQDAWTRFRYGAEDRVLPRGDLRNVSSSHRGDRTMLTLEDDTGGYYYLKGFVGTFFRDDRWIDDDGTLGDMEYGLSPGSGGLISDLHGQGLSGWIQLARQGDLDKIRPLTIHNLHADRRFLYLPYELTTLPAQLEKDGSGVFSTGENLLARGLFGQKTYTVKAVPSLAVQRLSGENRNLSQGKKGDKKASDPYSLYEEYVNRTCLTLSKEVKEALLEEMGGSSTVGVDDPLSVITRVRKWIGDRVVPDEAPGSVPEGKDFVSWFLEDNPKGYDVHCATMAVMLFRYYGIPSRYVEGFLVEGKEEITEKSAHAWPEIYLSGYGWVPVEVTDSDRKRMPSYINEDEELFSGSEAWSSESGLIPREQTDSTARDDSGDRKKDRTGRGGDKDTSPVVTGPGLWPGILVILVPLTVLLLFLVWLSGRGRRLFCPEPGRGVSSGACLIRWYQYCIFLLYELEDDPAVKASMTRDNRLVRREEIWTRLHPEVDPEALRQTGLLRQKAIYRQEGIGRTEAKSAMTFLRTESRLLYSRLGMLKKIRVRFGIRPGFIREGM